MGVFFGGGYPVAASLADGHARDTPTEPEQPGKRPAEATGPAN